MRNTARSEQLPDSWYRASANIAPATPALDGDEHCDVVVIGGGLSGLSSALHLAERGYSVRLLEARELGFGASGRSGGQLIFGYAAEEALLKKQLGLADARRAFALTTEALSVVKSRVAQHHIDCDLTEGMAHAAIKPRHVSALQAWQSELAEDFGYTHPHWIEGDAMQDYVQSQRYRGLLVDPNSAHLHPLNYTLGLAQAAIEAGAHVHTDSPVLGITAQNDRVTVRTPTGTVRARFAVLCTNAYLDNIEGVDVQPLRSRIMPVATYIAATEPLGARAAALLPQRSSVCDIQFVLDYFRLSHDNRLLFGGGVSYSGLDPSNLGEHMRRRMTTVFPQLESARIDKVWGGYVGITLNRAPHFGRLAPNILFMQGFSGHGMAMTTMAGQLAAEAIAGQAERFDLLCRLPHRPFPGGQALRTPALVLAMAWMRLRDWL